MKHGQRNIWVTIIAMIALWIAAVVSVWRLFEGGARSSIVIPAICFPIAAVLLTVSVVKLRKQRRTT